MLASLLREDIYPREVFGQQLCDMAVELGIGTEGMYEAPLRSAIEAAVIRLRELKRKVKKR